MADCWGQLPSSRPARLVGVRYPMVCCMLAAASCGLAARWQSWQPRRARVCVSLEPGRRLVAPGVACHERGGSLSPLSAPSILSSCRRIRSWFPRLGTPSMFTIPRGSLRTIPCWMNPLEIRGTVLDKAFVAVVRLAGQESGIPEDKKCNESCGSQNVNFRVLPVHCEAGTWVPAQVDATDLAALCTFPNHEFPVSGTDTNPDNGLETGVLRSLQLWVYEFGSDGPSPAAPARPSCTRNLNSVDHLSIFRVLLCLLTRRTKASLLHWLLLPRSMGCNNCRGAKKHEVLLENK